MFLPTTLKEVRARGWDQLDVILFTGDAYIDHPSFGAAVVGRLLEAEGYRVAIVPHVPKAFGNETSSHFFNTQHLANSLARGITRLRVYIA